MRNLIVVSMGLICVLLIVPFGWSGETPDTILIRKTLGDEATGWRTGNVRQIVSLYESPFTGYESYGSPDPKAWRVRFADLKEFEAFCKEALASTRYDISRTPLYFDIRAVGKDEAIVVAEEIGTRIDRTGGQKASIRDTTQLWMLEKVDEEWKITGFVRMMDGAEQAGASDGDGLEQVIRKEMEGWNASDVGKIMSGVASYFTGYEAYGKADLKTWKVMFRDPDEWKAFCKKRLSRTTYELSREVVSTDIRGDKALVVVEESGTTTHRETERKIASKHRDLWMLAKIGGDWKITGFIKRFGYH